MSEITTTIVGNLTADPVARTSQVGTTFTTFRVASTVRKRAQDGSYVDAHTNFVNVICFGALAQNAATSLHKGEPVILHGRLRTNTYGPTNDQRISVDVEAVTIGHDLTRGRTNFAKGTLAAELDRMSSDDARGALGDLAAGSRYDAGQGGDRSGEQHDGSGLVADGDCVVDRSTGEVLDLDPSETTGREQGEQPAYV